MIQGAIVLADAPSYAVKLETRGIDLFGIPLPILRTGLFSTGFIQISQDQAERVAAILNEAVSA